MAQLLKAQYHFLFLGKDSESFVENYAYDLGEGSEHGGRIFVTLEIQHNSLDAETVGDVIFDTLRKVFFADLDSDPYLRFEESLKEINRALNVLKQERGSDTLGKLNVLIAAIVNNNLYLTQSGDAEAYLIRKRFTTTISEGLEDSDSKDIFTNIASGELEPHDFLFLSSARLIRYISKTDLAKRMSPVLTDTLSSVKDALGSELLSKIALIGIQLTQNENTAFSSQVTPSDSSRMVHVEKEEMYAETLPSSSHSVARKEGDLKFSFPELKAKMVHFGKKIRAKAHDLVSERSFTTASEMNRLSDRRRTFADNFAIGNWGKDKLLVAIIGLVIVLALGVWWLKSNAEQNKKVQAYADDLVQVQEKINSAITNGPFNKDLSGKMLSEAEQKAIEVYNSGYHKAKARELLDQILETRDKLDGVLHPKVTKVVDLSTKRSNVSALGLLFLKGKLFAYEYNALYPILIDQLQDPLTIDDNEKVVSATVYDDKDSLLFYTESGKIIEYKDDKMNFLTTTDDSFKKGAKAIQAYSNKVYFLDAVGNQIWRYTRRRDKFDGAQPYAVGADLKNGVSFAIDGNIYVLNSDGFITKLFQGNKQNFSIKKQPVKPLGSPTNIFTNADISQIYILEPTENRVMVYSKDDRDGSATYTQQYVFDDLKGIRDFYVDKETNTMYLLDMTSVYKITL